MDFPGLIAARFDPGSVWLAGAGPGDPGLLTLHAAFALSQADVVVHDALVSSAILSLAPAARLEMAGKRAGGIRTQQLRINDRLIQLARQGLRVVRLKGGDPLVFGRGGEEALALAAAGIPFRIVPGISAGIGGTAAAGIPLTHRGLARSVAFATGHDSSGELADVDWQALSRGAEVLVFYMAQRRIGQIAERLIAAGRSAADPVALIANASTPEQVVRVTTLAEAATDIAQMQAGAPILILVGPTIALRPLLADWQQTEPMTVVSTTVASTTTAPIIVATGAQRAAAAG
jgi:uroporphyrin-III C-methyltransferase